MKAEDRRAQLLNLLKMDMKPMSASKLAEHFGVSRQIIVGDVALLRASGIDVIATPRGYVLGKDSGEGEAGGADTYVLACRHDKVGLEDELYTLADNGAALLSISIDHPLYGTITQKLDLYSRYDVDAFLKKVMTSGASLLCSLTDGVHLHTVRCADPAAYRRILMRLKELGILYTQ